MALLKDLRCGLDNGEITAFFQPQVDGITGEVIGFEALARWRHPERGMLDPGVFITLAFEHGLGDLCRNLGIVCLAEGVETEAEKNKLISLGCSRFQGYGVARPMPQDAVTEWLETQYGRHTTAKAG